MLNSLYPTVEILVVPLPTDQVLLNASCRPRGEDFIDLKMCLFRDAYGSKFFLVKFPSITFRFKSSSSYTGRGVLCITLIIPKDLRTEILFGRLGKFDLLLTDSNMLADAISCYFNKHIAPFFLHSLPQCEYIGICDICWSHAGRTVDRRVIASDKIWQYVDVSVRVFTCKIFVQFMAHGTLHSFDNRPFDIGVPTHLKLYALAFLQLLKWRVKEFFPFVGSKPDGGLLEVFEYRGYLIPIEKLHWHLYKIWILGEPYVRILKRRRLLLPDICNRHCASWEPVRPRDHIPNNHNIIDAIGVSR